MFQLALEGRQRIGQNDVVRQAIPYSWAGSTADCRHLFDWWYSKTVGASRTYETLVDKVLVDQRHGRVDRGKMERLHVGPCTSEQRACTVCTLGPATSEG